MLILAASYAIDILSGETSYSAGLTGVAFYAGTDCLTTSGYLTGSGSTTLGGEMTLATSTTLGFDGLTYEIKSSESSESINFEALATCFTGAALIGAGFALGTTSSSLSIILAGVF